MTALSDYDRTILKSLVDAGGQRSLDSHKSPARATRSVALLERDGLVSVSDDGSAWLVAITDAGRAALGGTKVGTPRRAGGSNVDLPSAEEIDADLTRWSHAIDDILESSKKATDELPYVEEAYETAWARAYVEALAETEAVSGRENFARMKTVKQKLAVDVAKGLKARFNVELEARRAQLSAAQSRVKLYTAQLNLDARGGD